MISNTLIEFVKNQQYLVIDKYQSSYTFSSLREMSLFLNINYSTISKKLAPSSYCFCKSKKNDNEYYITKLHNNHN
jgi:hypothetical protein